MAAPGTGDQRIRLERRKQRGEPALAGRGRILGQEHHDVTARRARREIPRPAVTELRGWNADDAYVVAGEDLERRVGRTGVDGDDLGQLEVASLPAHRRERSAEI